MFEAFEVMQRGYSPGLCDPPCVVGIDHLSPWRNSAGSGPSKLRTIVGADV